MEKILSLLGLAALILVSFPVPVLGEELVVPNAEIVLPVLPNPGLKPGDFFYFLDGWGESVREFFVFNPTRRAVLQTERALERIAEVQALLDEKGIEASGLDIAEAKIERNIARAGDILERERERGVEVSQLARRLEGDFTIRQKLLNQVFNSRREALKGRVGVIQSEIEEAREAENFERVTELRDTLENIQIQRERMLNRRNALQSRMIERNRRIREKMEEREREIRETETEKEALVEEGQGAVEELFEKEEMATEAEEEVLEIQLREAILAGDGELIQQIQEQLSAIKLQEELLETEREQLEEKLEEEERIKEVAEDLERTIDQEELRARVEENKREAGEAIRKAKEENITGNRIVFHLIGQAEKFFQRAVTHFEQGNYRRSYLNSAKAIDFAEKATRFGKRREQMERERPDLLPVPPRRTPTPPAERDENDDIQEPRIISQEKVQERITRAKESIKKVQEVIANRNITSPEAIKIIEKATEDLTKAQNLLKEGILNMAYHQATKAQKIADRFYRTILERLERGKERGTITPPAERGERRVACLTDADCADLICPTVIGGDTPRCLINEGERGRCICGPGDNYQRERRERLE